MRNIFLKLLFLLLLIFPFSSYAQNICYTPQTFQEKLYSEIEDIVNVSQQDWNTSLSRFTQRWNASASGTWIRNQNFWLKDIDMTGISIHNSQASLYRRNGALITPRHVLFTDHFFVWTGKTMTFMDDFWEIYTRTVTQLSTTSENGVYIAQLDSDLPSAIRPFRTFSYDLLESFFPNGENFYTINTSNTKWFAYLFEATDFAPPWSFSHLIEPKQVKAYEASNYGIPLLFSWYTEKIYGSDSSSPSFFIYEWEAFLLGSASRADDGDNILGYNRGLMTYALSMVDDINQTLDSISGVPWQYRFEVFSGIELCSNPPVMTLLGSTPLTLEVHSIYTDSGATATDLEDGNLTSSITSTGSVNTNQLGIYTITYSVTDSQSNTSSLMRTINVVDTTSPIITNPNVSPIKMIVWQTLNLQTVTCADNYDTNCSIIQSGAVDTNTVGTYIVTYTATDSSGNITTETQVVEVQPTYYAGWGTGGGRSRDVCQNGDSSGDIYDGKCEITVVPQTPVNPTVQESETSELDPTIDTPETNLEEATPKTETASSETDGYMQREVNGKLVGYTIEKTFEGCPIIDALNDENYEYKENFFPDTKTSKYPKILDIFGNLKITNGNTNGLFEPQREITRVEFTKMVLVSHCYEYQDEDTDEILYKDVGENTWEARVVSKAQELWIISGYDDGTFRPQQGITKAEATKILMRMSMLQSHTLDTLNYTDVEIEWHKKYVQVGETLWLFDAQEDGYMFEPDVWVEREEMVDLIYRLVLLYR